MEPPENQDSTRWKDIKSSHCQLKQDWMQIREKGSKDKQEHIDRQLYFDYKHNSADQFYIMLKRSFTQGASTSFFPNYDDYNKNLAELLLMIVDATDTAKLSQLIKTKEMVKLLLVMGDEVMNNMYFRYCEPACVW